MSSAPRRFEYHLHLPTAMPARAPPAGLDPRQPKPSDAAAMADLMLDAYHDTIDYDGGTRADAQAGVDDYLGGATRPLLEHSWLAVHQQDGLASACLVSWWPARQRPLIAYAMSAAAWKGRGLAAILLARCLADLGRAGYEEVTAVITSGNLPSDALFRRAGFRCLPSRGEGC